MQAVRHNPIIRASEFLRSTRDSGYHGTPLALAELIDNSIQAGAKTVEVRTIPTPETVQTSGDNNARVNEFLVLDDGVGMNPETLGRSLSFGGSSRFGSREGMGRFGMGLPNSSLSQCTHVEVYSWQGGAKPYMIGLDVEEVVGNEATELPPPRAMILPQQYRPHADTQSGTAVIWRKCDRLDTGGKVLSLLPKLRSEFGRIYRHVLADVDIIVGGDRVKPIDPLYLMKSAAIEGDTLAEQFGAPETITIPIPGQPGKSGKVVVTCSILPPAWQFAWRHNTLASKEAKEARHLAATVGISIVRAGRELQITKNPYHARHWTDTWYRIEVRFGPELDEVFGVTHTKQSITIDSGSQAFNYLEGVIVPRVQEMRRIIVERRDKLTPKVPKVVPARIEGATDGTPLRLVAAASSAVGPAGPDVRKEPGALDTFEGPVDILAEAGGRGKNPKINQNHAYYALYAGLPLTAKVAVNPFIKAAASLDPETAREFGHKLKLVMTRKKPD